MFGSPTRSSRRGGMDYNKIPNNQCSNGGNGNHIMNDNQKSPMRRSTLKDACNQSSLERRHQRRHEWSSQIRKVRKSHQIQLKRRNSNIGMVVPNENNNNSSNSNSNSMTISTNSYITDNTNMTMTGGASSSSSCLLELCELYIKESMNNMNNKNEVGRILATLQSVVSKDVDHYHREEEEEMEDGSGVSSSSSSSSCQPQCVKVGDNNINNINNINNVLNSMLTKRVNGSSISISSGSGNSSCNGNGHVDSKVEEEEEVNDDGLVMAVCLLKALSKSLIHGGDVEEQMNAARCLTNLAACSSSNHHHDNNGCEEESSSSNSYYGRPVETWCTYMVRSDVGVLSAWIHVVRSFLEIAQRCVENPTMEMLVSQNMIDLTEQCCWALGNIAGDSSFARQVILQPSHQHGHIPSFMIQVLYWSHQFQSLTQQAAWITTNNANANNNANTKLVVVGLCRNAAWALSNLARGADTSASLFLQPPTTAIAGTAISTTTRDGLTPRLLAYLLTSPERYFQSPTAAATDVTSSSSCTWSDVSLETMWFTAFLTAREDQAVDYLCSSDDNNNNHSNYNHTESAVSILCEALAFRLGYVAHVLSLFSNFSAAGDKTIQAMDVALSMAVPSIRAVGNIATACNGRYVSKLLTAKAKISTDNEHVRHHNQHLLTSSYGPITASIARIMQDASNPPAVKRQKQVNLMAVAAEAAWAAGALLCDAGTTNTHTNTTTPHPSTTIAFPTFLPPLCNVITSEYAKLQFKREALLALNHAVAPPPLPNNNHNYNNHNNHNHNTTINNNNTTMLDQFLQAIAPKQQQFIPSLVDLLLSYDSDAVFASLQLTNLILRRSHTLQQQQQQQHQYQQPTIHHHIHTIQQTFEEANILTALETICDRASSTSSSFGQHQWNHNNHSTNHNNHSTNHNLSEKSADIAADLIDDFFDNDDHIMDDDDHNNDMIFNLQPATSTNTTFNGPQQTTFAFGLTSTSTSNNNINHTTIKNHFDFSSTTPTTTTTSNLPPGGRGRGRGRGRGHNVPAWMQTRTV